MWDAFFPMILIAMSLNALLVFYKIDSQSLWTDEFWTLKASGRDLYDICFVWLQGDVHPPFYFVVLHFWRLIFGSSALSIRAFSAIMGTLCIPILYLIGKEFGRRVGLLQLCYWPFHHCISIFLARPGCTHWLCSWRFCRRLYS